MFSGKTTELIRRIKRYQYANYRCMIVRYAKDDRYDSERISTHDQQKLRAVSAVELTRLAPLAKEVDVIAVDEGQFFPDIVSFAESMANARKIVLVAALDGTFQRTGFCDILRLIPLAESVEKLTAVCMSCFRDAAFTKRLGQETEVELIGGQEKYMAVCRECHKLEAPVRRSPFKSLTNTAEPSPFKSLSTNQNTGSDQAPPPKDVADKKRKLFEEEPKDSSVPPIKSLRQTQV